MGGFAGEFVRLEVADGVGTIRLDRPKMNAISIAVQEELRAAAAEATAREDVRAVVLWGGERVFAAGNDVKEMSQMSYQDMVRASRGVQSSITAIATIPKPVVAAINGYALGGGCELALACTLRIAADKARLGQPEINLGIIPGYAGTQRLARLVGKGVALDLLLTGRHSTAAEALQIGLVNRVVPAADLMTEVRKLASELAAKPPIATRYILEAVNRGLEMPLGQGQFLEATLFGLVASTDDMREGTAAFLEKRKADFKGR